MIITKFCEKILAILMILGKNCKYRFPFLMIENTLIFNEITINSLQIIDHLAYESTETLYIFIKAILSQAT